jgi:putative ABC transport system permease protein
MEGLRRDVRYALRMLRKNPGFTLAAIFTLALGMGANTTMFSVLNTVLLRPLPYPNSNKVVQIWETEPRAGVDLNSVSPYNFLEWQKSSHSFAAIAAYDYDWAVLGGLKTPQRVATGFVSAGFFDVFQVSPLKGRTFRPDEDTAGSDRATVLSEGAWARYFDRDRDIVGKTIFLDGVAHNVIGVMPAQFAFPSDRVEVWCTPAFDVKKARRGNHYLSSVGRVSTGLSIEQAEAELKSIANDLNQQDGRSSSVHLVELQEQIVGNVRRRILLLYVAVLAVLLIACANVAGLLLGRAVARQKEVAIRTALGGSRRHLVRQFVVESAVLVILGSCLGIILSYVADHFLSGRSRLLIPRLRDLQIDGWVLGFTLSVCIMTGLVFGVVPALQTLRVDVLTRLKESGAASLVLNRVNFRTFLVTAELALAMVLLVTAGLLTKTLWRLQQVDPGFQVENLVSFRFSVPNGKYTSPQRFALYQRVVERLAVLPGIESAGATNDLPFGGSRSGENFAIEGRAQQVGETLASGYRTISSDYMQTMRIRLLSGREFTPADNVDAPYVVIVNQAFVKKYFHEEDPLGHILKIKSHLYTIAGVVADVKHESLAAPGQPEMYVPYAQADPSNSTFVVVRGRTGMQAISDAIRNTVREIAPQEPIYGLSQMNQLIESQIFPQKFNNILLAVFAGLALVLSAIGTYGIINYNVAQRTREIGIRMALGAKRSDVLKMILLQGARIGIVGLAIGAVGASLATHLLSGMLFEVHPYDPGIFLATAITLIAVIILAAYMPARRATAIDPLIALRDE